MRADVTIRHVVCIMLQVRHELQQELQEALLGPIQHTSADHRPGHSGLRMSQHGGRDSQSGHHGPSGGWPLQQTKQVFSPIAAALVWQLNAT